jgi:gliding motility-associated-like protein
MKRQLLTTSILLAFFSCLSFQSAYATHNRAGEITYRIIDGLTIEATITTYTKASSVAADRDTLEICWSEDGPCEKVGRVNGNGNGVVLANDTKINKYIAIHTYSGIAHYVISMTDPNRNGGILNVNWPNSENVPFHLETTVTFFNPLFQGPNNSPILSQPPIDIACLGQEFVHNPNAWDPDGDSLAYRLIVPFQGINSPVPLYMFPDMINPSTPTNPNNHTLDEATGTFTWTFPQRVGEYNIAMYIIQYRGGTPIDTMIRDMQILVVECDNLPPEIETIDQICVVAGETVSFDVTATAPTSESTQQVDLLAFGAPLEATFSPATFSVAPGYQPQPLTGTFTWETKCEHIANQYYTVVFRAADDFAISIPGGESVYLSTLKTVRIKVVGPPPEDLQADPGNGRVDLSWELPYACDDVMDNYFQGFRVWRKEGPNALPIELCDPGLEGKGYTLLTLSPIVDVLNNRYNYIDEDVERGKTYCYRVEGRFAKLSAANQPFNWVSSLPSDSICVQLSRDIPLITNVTVLTTDTNNGEIQVRWSKPDPTDLDTIANPGPYIYELYRAEGITPADSDFQLIPGATFTSPSFSGANDTIYDDAGLNTSNLPYSYKIAFYANDEAEPIGFTQPASSVFLSIASTDNINNLSWDFDVPWNNSKYIIYKENISGIFDSIGVSLQPMYSDQNLINGKEYCYKVKSIGTYGIERIITPIINDSQEECGIPLDTIPPCPPELEVSNICDNLGSAGEVNCESVENLVNSLIWKNPMEICEETDDVVSYNIYYAPFEGADFQIIETIPISTITDYEHFPDFGIAGCYAVTAVDTFFNESAFSNIVCKDNCPIYNLPNVFTPNGDGANDLYIPFPYCFIESIEMQIYNRWGNLVFETTDPDINWDGKNLKGNDVAEGVYFYTCKVYEQRVSGIVRQADILQGSIQIIRGNR